MFKKINNKPFYIAAAVFSIFMSGTTALAQETRPLLTLDMAKKMASACEAMQKEQKFPKINIAIVDRGADLVLFLRQNDAFLGSVKIAIDKAKSSALVPFPTRSIEELIYGKDGNPGVLPGLIHSDLVAFAGGLPVINSSGVLVGAIGVSGAATADQDEDCARAAIAAIADKLK